MQNLELGVHVNLETLWRECGCMYQRMNYVLHRQRGLFSVVTNVLCSVFVILKVAFFIPSASLVQVTDVK